MQRLRRLPSDQRPRPPPTLADAELPVITPMRFVVAHHEDGHSTLEVRESEFEQVYNLRDPYSCAMFVALCRHEGVKAYRRGRQRQGTVCVKASLSNHDVLWARFLALTSRLDARLAEVMQQFVRDEIEGSEL